MDNRFGRRSLRVKLHGVRFDADNRWGVGGEQAVRVLGKHGIGQILHHEYHPVCR